MVQQALDDFYPYLAYCSKSTSCKSVTVARKSLWLAISTTLLMQDGLAAMAQH